MRNTILEHIYCPQGQSWSMGGDSDAQSVAAFLRFYTPNITGASVGHHIVEVRASHLSCRLQQLMVHAGY